MDGKAWSLEGRRAERQCRPVSSPTPALSPRPRWPAGSRGLRPWWLASARPAVQLHFHSGASPPPRVLLPSPSSDLRQFNECPLSQDCEILEGRGGFSSSLRPLLGLAPSRGSGNACTTHQGTDGSGTQRGGVSSNPCPAPTGNPRLFELEETLWSRNVPEGPGWKSEGSHLCPATRQTPRRGYSYLASPFSPAPNPSGPLPFSIWQNKGTVFMPAPTPTQSAAPGLLPLPRHGRGALAARRWS